jgi:hypothetical protein
VPAFFPGVLQETAAGGFPSSSDGKRDDGIFPVTGVGGLRGCVWSMTSATRLMASLVTTLFNFPLCPFATFRISAWLPLDH